MLAGFGIEWEANEAGERFVIAKVLVYCGTLDCAFLDGHPAELGLGAIEGECDDAHHARSWRVAGVFEDATEQFVDFPVGLLTFGAAIVDVLAAGAELARLGTDSTLVVGGCHGVMNYRFAGTMV